jgi:threonine dehydrogenase-like Zn-dependent dehydrogenase
MKGVILTGTHTVEVQEIQDATIEESTDVLMRVTSAAICGTDLHFYDGRMPYDGHLIGHEPLGVVEEAGPVVHSLKKRRSHRGAHAHLLRVLRELLARR